MKPIINNSLDLYMRKFEAMRPTTKRGDMLDMQEVSRTTGLSDPWRLWDRIQRWYMREHGIHTKRRGNFVYLSTAREQAIDNIETANNRLKSTCRNVIRRVGAVDPLSLSERERIAQERGLDFFTRHAIAAREEAKRITFCLEGRTSEKLTG